MMAQKSAEGTFLNNIFVNKIGLLNTGVRVGDHMFPSNVLSLGGFNGMIDKFFLVRKPDKKEKGAFNDHKTVKPLAICEHILKLTSFYQGAVVLDPFLGSGTTAVAAKNLGINYIGIEINPEYVDIARKRLKRLETKEYSSNVAQKSILDLL